jgi:hypothetical protein
MVLGQAAVSLRQCGLVRSGVWLERLRKPEWSVRKMICGSEYERAAVAYAGILFEGRGFNKFSLGQRAERTGMGGR